MKTINVVKTDAAQNTTVNNDIRQAMETLRENEYLLRESQVVAGLGTYVLDIPSGLWRCSDVMDEIFGIGETHVRSVEGWAALIHPDDRTMMLDYFHNEVLGKRQPFNKEYRIIRHNSKDERWLHGWGKLEFDAQGHPGKMLGIIQDITLQKQSETALRESEAKFAKVFHDAPVWIAITDMTDATYLDMNESALRASGFTREEVIGQTASELGWITLENRGRLLQEIAVHGKIAGMEVPFRAKNGHTLYGWVTGEIIVINGRSALLTVTTDITDRKKADEKLATQMDELRRWQAVTLGREGRIGELKREVNALAVRLGLPPPYGATENSAPKEKR